jgi:hypothetical protein
MLDEAQALWATGGGAKGEIGMTTESLYVTVARGHTALAERSA